MPAARTPAFLARDDDLVALDPAGRLEIGQRRAGARFRHRDRHDLVALDHVRNDPCLKRVGGEMLNGPNRAGGAFEEWPGDRRGNHRELFERSAEHPSELQSLMRISYAVTH